MQFLHLVILYCVSNYDNKLCCVPTALQNIVLSVTPNMLTSFLKMFCVCSVFCPASTDDEARDLANQKRIRSFNWITPQHLDAAINPDSDKVQQLIEDAQQGNA